MGGPPAGEADRWLVGASGRRLHDHGAADTRGAVYAAGVARAGSGGRKLRGVSASDWRRSRFTLSGRFRLEPSSKGRCDGCGPYGGAAGVSGFVVVTTAEAPA